MAEFSREGWTPARFNISCSGGESGPVDGWTCGVWGIAEYSADYDIFTMRNDNVECEASKARVASVTHIPTGLRFCACIGLDEAAEAVEIAGKVADWAALRRRSDTRLTRWKSAWHRTNKAWSIAGFAELVNFNINGKGVLTKCAGDLTWAARH